MATVDRYTLTHSHPHPTPNTPNLQTSGAAEEKPAAGSPMAAAMELKARGQAEEVPGYVVYVAANCYGAPMPDPDGRTPTVPT